MAAYRSSNSATGAASSAVVTKPTGLAVGDLMIAFCSEGNSTQSLNTPSGWTSFLTGTSTLFDQQVIVFVKIADAGDVAASNFTFTATGTTPIEVVLLAISGTFALANNIYASIAESGTEAVSDALRFPTGLTPTVANSLLIMYVRSVCADSDNNAMSAYATETSSPTWTERHDIQDAGGTNTIRIGVATATRTETTATGYFQAGVGAGNITPTGSVGILLAIADTQNASPTLDVVTASFTVPTVSPTADANVSAPAVISFSASVPSVTPTVGEALWKNTDKPSPGSITNVDKP